MVAKKQQLVQISMPVTLVRHEQARGEKVASWHRGDELCGGRAPRQISEPTVSQLCPFETFLAVNRGPNGHCHEPARGKVAIDDAKDFPRRGHELNHSDGGDQVEALVQAADVAADLSHIYTRRRVFDPRTCGHFRRGVDRPQFTSRKDGLHDIRVWPVPAPRSKHLGDGPNALICGASSPDKS